MEAGSGDEASANCMETAQESEEYTIRDGGYTITSQKRMLFEGTVWARNEQHAIKIMNERRIGAITCGELERALKSQDEQQH